MPNYTFNQEIFEQANKEPVLLTLNADKSHVLMSFEIYQQLINHLQELEDLKWGKMAIEALNKYDLVGEDEFIKTLEELANG
jgi:hypothetical protein